MYDSIGQDRKDVFYNKKNMPDNTINKKKEDDKLDFLFDKQNELFKKQLENNKNKMENLYEIREPFEGYRIFMLSTALVH